MAELDTSSSGGGKKHGGTKSKKASTRVDLTAMVDLGFLLITFFMFTTTFNKPKVMKLNMPDKDNKTNEDMPVKESLTTTFVLAPGDSLYYWNGLGLTPGDVKLTNYSPEGMRKIILGRQAEIKRANPDEDLIVLIKPMEKSVYKNTVDFLDEMAITDTKTYALVDITDADKKIIKDNLAK
jgi:biopolymer transport protein ExbD